ncbi:uncharacterized protein K452DRAFT_282848 [Aplosporella prunicola CBS 121167]|uniref:Uncharacterized protein n=1 Tax=Aplosporella prunicola CBS 121167 TaxID=1176127 RepID=A0A6A6BVF9_9PEZI|nr:uncharacterized protein K452DRAFT_282848 [Aplosporella prunicola CBS 121167]KAF2146671.1 hypothetical protein K452DRAFT_282848 [Aplosporella prunicola CBS 121167]
MASTATVVSVFAGLVALLAAYAYFFGISPAVKRQMEEKALKTMGENKASYLVKDQVNKLPASDQKDVKEVKKGLGNLAGGSLQNPVGKFAGDTADEATRPLTGR